MADREEIGETQILAAVLGVAEMVGGLSDMDELLASIVRVAPGLVQVDRCAIMAYDGASREFRTVASFGSGGQSTAFDGLQVQESEIPRLAQRLIVLRLPALVKAASQEAGLPPSLQKRLSLKSALVVPLAARGRFLGILWLDDTRSPHYFTSREINIVQGVAAQAAIALDGGKLATQLDLERRRFDALVSALADGLLVVDRDLRVLHLDRGAEALLGWQSSEVRGRRMHEVFDISQAEASIAWTKEKSGPAPAPKALRLRAHDGLPVECTAQAIEVRGDEGELIQVLYALRKRPGTKGYADRMMDSIDQLTPLQRAEPPE
ncbi:MAG TPA: GAF domain-containing protein [Thermoplasmata archaeon]|nr:GAF domain-containing protein [Thermoplasmata archaeon]